MAVVHHDLALGATEPIWAKRFAVCAVDFDFTVRLDVGAGGCRGVGVHRRADGTRRHLLVDRPGGGVVFAAWDTGLIRLVRLHVAAAAIFVSVAPMLVVLAVVGLGKMLPTGSRPGVAAVIILSLLPGISLAGFQYLPMRTTVEQKRLDVVIQAVKEREAGGVGAGWNGLPPVVGHPYVQMELEMPFDSPEQIRVPIRQKIMRAPVGTLLVVDSMMWRFEGRPTEEELRRWGYEEDAATAAKVDAVKKQYELLTYHPDAEGHVRLWVRKWRNWPILERQ